MSKKFLTVLLVGGLVFWSCSIGLQGDSIEGVQSLASRSLAAPTSTMTYLQNFADTRLMAGYEGEILYSNSEIGYSNVYVRYGFNGWQSIGEAKLSITDPTAHHLQATIPIPSWARTINYAVYTVQEDGTQLWDNNDGFDFQAPVYPSLTQIFSNYDGTYRIRHKSRETSAIIHYGFDGWQNVQEKTLSLDQQGTEATGVNTFETTLAIEDGQSLNYVFRTEGYKWDNNAGQDYFYSTEKGSFMVEPRILGQGNARELSGLWVKAYNNGYQHSEEIKTWKMGMYVHASFGNLPRGDYSFVIDERKDGYRYYGTGKARIQSQALPIFIHFDVEKKAY